MAKLHIKRFYYRSGRIHAEVREVEREFHNLSRNWHFNGQLAGELRYRHGLLHGVSREWNECGRLLGSFKMNQGTGTQRYWHDNGRIKMEIDSLNGRFHGRIRVWLRDGTLVQETFHIRDNTVSRAAYLNAARKNPDWPQYQGESAGKVARRTLALERKQLELLIESILEKSHAEARRWLSHEKRRERRSLAKFRTSNTALRFVETLYTAGANAVLLAPIYKGKRGKLFADWILVRLPKECSKRRALRKICQDFCRKRDGAMLPDKDISESHLFLRLA
jgi:hypothetical protein